MATFFGEVLPVYSRAVDDDIECEDDDLPEAIRIPVFRWKAPGLDECRIFTLAIGPVACETAWQYLLSAQESEIIGVASLGAEAKFSNSLSQRASADRSCIFSRLVHDPTTVVCTCNITLSVEEAFHWTTAIFDKLPTDIEIIILASHDVSEHKCEALASTLDVPFIRWLATDSVKVWPQLPDLKSPNFITGLPASVMSLCQLRQYPAVAYILYTNFITKSTSNIEKFVTVLQNTTLSSVLKVHQTQSPLAQKHSHSQQSHGNLYL